LKYGFLTERQFEVLKLRARGLTQEEIAKILGTSRENVSVLEKRAKEKVEKARETIRAFESLNPVKIVLPQGLNLFSAPEFVFQKADMHGIKVRYNSTALIGIIRRKAGDKIAVNTIAEPVEIKLLRNGDVIIEG